MSGRLFVISAPSGAGKTSLVKALLAQEPQLRASVSHTTRGPRPTEQAGREYHFVSPKTFTDMVNAGGFLEHAQVFDNHYGTGREQLEQTLAAGHDVILEIDWQGARQVRAARPDCQSIFVLPPSREALRVRLTARQTDTEAVITRRLADALAQLQQILRGEGDELRSNRASLAPALRNLLA